MVIRKSIITDRCGGLFAASCHCRAVIFYTQLKGCYRQRLSIGTLFNALAFALSLIRGAIEWLFGQH